jgi:Ca2+-dependent lipid-binding protein
VNLQTSEANLTLDFHYTPLPPFSLLIATSPCSCPQVAGVLYVHVHSGSELLSGDADGLSDPYCVVLANKKKVSVLIKTAVNE